jgi:hypothetical protein
MRESTITMSQACGGLVRYKSVVGLSPNTIHNYRYSFSKLLACFSDDPLFTAITEQQLVGFFAYLPGTAW